MLLRGQNLERFVFLLPHLVDLENEVGFVVAHFRLVRLEQEQRRRRIFVLGVRLMAHGLRHHARLLCEMRGAGMVEIIRVLERVGEHEGRIGLAIDVDHAVVMLLGQIERVVAAVEELDLGAEQAGGALGLVLAAGLDLRQRGARLLPGELAFAALAERQAHDLDPVAALGVQRDGAARAPDEVARMGGNDKSGLLIRHGRINSLFSVRIL